MLKKRIKTNHIVSVIRAATEVLKVMTKMNNLDTPHDGIDTPILRLKRR
jgi:hypothetical protein